MKIISNLFFSWKIIWALLPNEMTVFSCQTNKCKKKKVKDYTQKDDYFFLFRFVYISGKNVFPKIWLFAFPFIVDQFRTVKVNVVFSNNR